MEKHLRLREETSSKAWGRIWGWDLTFGTQRRRDWSMRKRQEDFPGDCCDFPVLDESRNAARAGWCGLHFRRSTGTFDLRPNGCLFIAEGVVSPFGSSPYPANPALCLLARCVDSVAWRF